MEKWFVAAKKADFNKWAEEFRISPVLARILRNRDLTDEAEIEKFLHGTLADCYSPWLLEDMDRAVDLILQAIADKKHLRVIGDYDVDGICSSYILTKGLQVLGAEVDTAIPHRIHDGYGLNDNLIEEAKQDGVELIITCDNGIAAAPQIELAASFGIGVIVTDHHEVPFSLDNGERKELLPPALAVVDPKREECTYPYKNICGGVVAYKCMQALLEKTNSPELARAIDELLQFAAIATVCDVMELRDENRIIVKEGLRLLQHTENEGIRALMEVNSIEPAKLSAYHLGFVLGPCLNATGRLDTAQRALELLQSHTKVDAMSAARELKDLNDSRKNLTLQGVREAEEYIREHHMEEDPVMLIFLPEVHESLAGIIAGRVREKYNHPVFILTQGEEGVKGSGRSIESYHMYDHMTAVKQYFTKFGGHKLAAGLSMREEDIEPLRKALNENSGLSEEDFVPRVHIDVPMPLSYATEELAEELSLLEPFGVGNPKPLFAQKELVFLSGYRMGANKNFARYRVRTPEGTEAQMVFFGDLEQFEAFLDEKFGTGCGDELYNGGKPGVTYNVSVVYQLSLNTYRGKTELQFLMQNYC
ncbi:MAG: single-stranded-DNA-specific exonuclease RecJ [Acetatifactor sp.]|nr:single-stranded-DNA-specific exonuclease RecJ [Acetatifactor sp.]